MTLTLRDYQMKQAKFHWENKKTLNDSQPGTGKTPVFCTMAKWNWEREQGKTVLVNPVSLSLKNREEMLRWTGFAEDEVVIVKGNAEQRLKLYANPKIKVFISSFETFSKEWGYYPKGVELLVADESHLAYSTHTSKRTQEMYKVARRVKRVLFCTGTPVNGRYNSIYPIAEVCCPMYYGNYNRFMNIHAVRDTFNHVVAWKDPNPIKKMLDHISVGITTAEAYKNAPKTLYFDELCEMDSKQYKSYKEMEVAALAELDDAYIEAQNPCTQALRCRQLLSCPEALGLNIKTFGKDEVLKVHLENAKLSGERLLVFSVFVKEQERLVKVCQDMGLKVALINGSTSGAKRGEIAKKFENHELDVVVGSPATMATGFNFEFISEVIFVSCSYEDSVFEQGVARGNRGTRTTPLRVYTLKYDVPVEHRIWEVIKRKTKERLKIS